MSAIFQTDIYNKIKGEIQMSQAKIEQFNQLVEQDSALQERLNQAEGKESVIAVIMEIAKEKGYSFTKQEAEKYVRQLISQQEISEEQLESIAGGAAKTDILYGNFYRC